jgi:hypothetical protein
MIVPLSRPSRTEKYVQCPSASPHDDLVVGGLVPQHVTRATTLALVACVTVTLDGERYEVDVALEAIELRVVHGP